MRGKRTDDNERLQHGEDLHDPERDAKEMTDDDTESGAPGPTEWEPPSPFESLTVPKFPISCLPTPLDQFVAELAVATQVPPDVPGSLALAAVAACVQRKVVVEVNPGYFEPTSLYVAVVAESGTRKSAVIGAITSPFLGWERQKREELQPIIEQARMEREIKEARKEKLQDQAAKTDDAEDRAEAIREAVELQMEMAEDGPVPVYPQLLADDATPEALARLMAEQGERVALFSAEGGIFELMAGRYSQGVPNLDVFLKSHAGDFLRINRRSGPPVEMNTPALTIGLAIQPDVLRELADKPGFRGRGLLARFLYSLPPSIVGRRLSDAPSMPEATAQQYERCVCRLLDTEADEGGSPIRLTLSNEAAEIRLGFATRFEPRLGLGGDLGHMADWAGKAVGASVRIAGLLHCVQCAQAEQTVGGAIEGATMKAAVDLVEGYFVPHAQAALAEMGADPAIDRARRVVAWLLNHDLDEFCVRDLHQALRGQGCFHSIKAVVATVDMLETHTYVRRVQQPRQGVGRPPSARYKVNPLARRHASRNPQNPQNVADAAMPQNSEDSVNSGEGHDGVDPRAGSDPQGGAGQPTETSCQTDTILSQSP